MLPGANTSHTIWASLVKPMSTPYFLMVPVYLSAMPSVRVNRQLRSLDEPKMKPTPPATVQEREPTFVPDLPAAAGVPGLAGVWAWAPPAAATSKSAAPAVARTDRNLFIPLGCARLGRGFGGYGAYGSRPSG